MKDSNEIHPQQHPVPSRETGFSPWQRLKSKRISYLTLPLLVMATVTEFVILATGWKYQQVVCVPKGMGVTFLGIGPIGATILAVELLKLPLAIWTASRRGWQKGLMITVGLPLICLLTFQLVKDMAVYEMGVAMAPANEMLAKATDEEVRISQLKGSLTEIEKKKSDRQSKLAELTARETKAKADLDESLKRNEDLRKDAISLTDYQRKELTDVDARESAIIQQFNSDADQINKSLADLRARRETEIARDTKWNAEEARIDNAYKAKLADYENKKAAYLKDKAEYDGANVLRRQLMTEPVDPGVPPVRESNTILKSTLVADLEAQIKSKETELASVNSKRRDRVAQVEADARQLRDEFDKRSGTKREEADKSRQQSSAAYAAVAAQLKDEEKLADADLATAVQKVDGIRADLDAAQKRAEGLYESREASIRTTQVHRIATTVEIIRGLIKGERPMSIKATAKERGDILTDQISMVRIWVYPVLAFIVAFLPTLMVEIGFSTVFEPQEQRPAHRLGFFGQRLHQLYIRAGRQKLLRVERLAREANAKIASRDKALAEAQSALNHAQNEARATVDQSYAEKEVELQKAREFIAASNAAQEEKLKMVEEEYAQQAKRRESEWVAKLAGMADSLNRTVLEKDTLRDLQKSEIERQIQMRQNAWSERLSQMRQELDQQRAASESERTTMMQEHQKKLLEVAEDCKTQVIQARRQAAEAEMGAVDKSARLAHDLKEALHARDTAESQLKHQADTQALKLTQIQEDSARELEKAARQEKLKLERQQAEFEKMQRQREDAFEYRIKQREQELNLAFESRLTEEKTKLEQEARVREEEREKQLEARVHEVEEHWNQDVRQREDSAQSRLKQRELQLQAQTEVRVRELQTQAEEQLRRRESEFERQLETQTRGSETRLREELQQKESQFHARLKQREQELAAKAETRLAELQKQWAVDLRAREEDWERQAGARVRAVETRLSAEAQHNEELFQAKLGQRDQQWQAKLDVARTELQAQHEEVLRRRRTEADGALRELESRLREEIRQKEAAALARAKQQEKELAVQLQEQAEARLLAAHAQWESETEIKLRTVVEPVRIQLIRTEKERDEARHATSEGARRVHDLEKKLTEASLFLNNWRNGKSVANATS